MLTKRPFQVLLLRGSLFHRTDELLNSAVMLLEADNVVAAFLVVRAVMENMAMQHRLIKMLATRNTTDPAEMTEVLNRMIVGVKMQHSIDGEMDYPQPINVMTFIEHFSKENATFKMSFESLCELAHPNHQGVASHYSELDPNPGYVTFGPKPETNRQRKEIALEIMNVCIEIYLVDYLNIARDVEEWVSELKAQPQTA
ncbi:hypothetical protein ABAC460_17240 [Asticcacaulis sp. AC460]|nr:hypothetical protein ABAC460_17240 [Asticcacaulis sp. AC460]